MVEDIYTVSFTAMGSRCEVRIAAADAAAARHIATQAIDEVRRIEQKYSRYRSDSIVSRINAAAGLGAVDCDGETAALLAYADALHDNSEGRFDITSGVLRKAWDFRGGALPRPGALEALLPLVGWSKVVRDESSVFLPQLGMELDFGGFGKEYAVDRAAELLAVLGVDHGYVNLGGDMRFLGPRPDGKPWDIGIQDPRDMSATVASIPIGRGALATSGDYERFIEVDGRRYCHVLDPRSGMPVSYWRSVSVVGPLAITAGSCTTTAMLLEQDGIDFLDRSGVSYLAIDHEGRIFRRT
ncbi:thiamine biosynthesis lipoprotein [Duganella sp. SG902]|uniref:FAD:protein FMN transferase n=1 Tax=Duganella sp. SG902 TaxID=2587016 RepID=UPI00159DE3E8|nr:FAD:protein FMN transferase [Duganella sp. SG902]NVM75656.1 thiamine biosynthesis lipoprotein [Duganella sp. SG902]